MSAVLTPLEITTPPKRYAPANQCIYCGRKTISRHKEHIIAYALAGDSLVFPMASCSHCQNKINEFESNCLRSRWWPFRVRIGAPSRGKEPPEAFRVRKIKVTSVNERGEITYDKAGTEEVRPHEHPFLYITYRFPPPGVLSGRDPSANVKFTITALFAYEEARKYTAKDKEGFDLGPGQPDQLLQLLAKVAHGYAVAELGIGSFQPSLTKFIRGLFPFTAYHWIGSDPEVPPASSQSLHEIGLHIEQIGPAAYVVVTFRLFSFLPTPQYRIVVGELERPFDQRTLLKQVSHTIEIKAPPPITEVDPFAGAPKIGISGV
jgi:hypothetical protein